MVTSTQVPAWRTGALNEPVYGEPHLRLQAGNGVRIITIAMSIAPTGEAALEFAGQETAIVPISVDLVVLPWPQIV